MVLWKDDRALFDEFFPTLTFFPKLFVKCGRRRVLGSSAVTPVMNYFGNTGSKRLGNRVASVSCRFAFERALETLRRGRTHRGLCFQCDDGRVHK